MPEADALAALIVDGITIMYAVVILLVIRWVITWKP